MSRYIEYDAIDYRNDKMHDKSSDFIDGVIYMAQRIEEAPSIDIEPKRGEWINKHEWSNGFFERECSVCGAMKPQLMHTAKINFCPNCGADMRGKDDE